MYPFHYAGSVAPLPGSKEGVASGGGGPMPGIFQGQAGKGSEQPDPVEDVPAHCKGVGLDGL